VASQERRCDVFLAPLAEGALDKALGLQRELRRAGVRVLMDYEGRGLKAKMKLADKLGARYVAILGEDELSRGAWAIRDMRDSSQEEVSEARAAERLAEKLHG
jgi:histidyl-tRNA synthetase